jgi:uncharacterized membrane protein
MPTVNHNPGQSDQNVIVLKAQLAFIFINESIHKVVDLFCVIIRDVFGLMEKERCRIFEFFHLTVNLNDFDLVIFEWKLFPMS